MLRELWAGCAAIILVFAAGVTSAEEKVLNVYNWSDYIAEDTIANFEERTGIKVNYDVFDSNEVLEAKLLAGNSGYDVVVPAASFLERQIVAGVFAKLDKSKLSNHGNLDGTILERVAAHDPDNEHAVPYMWGTTGFGYNVAKVNEIMEDAPTDSWRMLFDPDVVAELASCGVTLLDAPTEVFANLMGYLGLDPNSDRPEDVELFEEHLLKIRPHVRYFHSSQNINDLANGEICVAMGWSGDMLIARDRAAEAGQGIEIAYTIPREGAVIWFDNLAIPERRAASGERTPVPGLHDGAGGGCGDLQLCVLRQRQQRIARVCGRCRQDRSGDLSLGRRQGEPVRRSGGLARFHPAADAGVDEGENRPLTARPRPVAF